jgi:hypothetical protein
MEFELNADVQAVDLLLSHTELDFAFSLDDWLPHVDRILRLENPNNFPALFVWDNPCPGLFNISPLSGSVPPLSSMEIAVRWAPSTPVQPVPPGNPGAQRIALKAGYSRQEHTSAAPERNLSLHGAETADESAAAT